MATIGPDGVDSKGELLDDVIDEVDRALLVASRVDHEGADSRSVVDGRELVAADPAIVVGSQIQELHVYLDLMARDFLGISARVDRASADIARQGTDAIAFERAIDARTGGLEAVVALKIPGNPLGTKMVGRSQVEDLFDVLRRDLPRVTSSYGPLAEQASPSFSLICLSPPVE